MDSNGITNAQYQNGTSFLPSELLMITLLINKSSKIDTQLHFIINHEGKYKPSRSIQMISQTN